MRKHLPVTAGYGIVNAFASLGPRIEPSHLRRNIALIHVDQVLGRDLDELIEELFALLTVGFGVALGGMERLFLSTRPSLPTTRHRWAIETRWPVTQRGKGAVSFRSPRPSGISTSRIILALRGTRRPGLHPRASTRHRRELAQYHEGGARHPSVPQAWPSNR